MPARKIAISISREALALVDRCAAEEGLSRSAWFERAARQARRRVAVDRAVREVHRSGVKRASDAELKALRREIAAAS